MRPRPEQLMCTLRTYNLDLVTIVLWCQHTSRCSDGAGESLSSQSQLTSNIISTTAPARPDSVSSSTKQPTAVK
eukprot:scaffold70960_cov34-Cyclotella_meneghiniana.AAC.2